ncbi:MAG TPA: 2-amino-4-hydroxy-6-hydroxymethyldihydropteridine diphosphokinase [Rhizomicrobium sp.]|jgi:2-amino-4-hydroxy-6-hydroxymethyldihydropteridine diphosphokinase|nr:2-amino-4-hydroxy-6-hydroxymethyldihydropteridine diphosphokinase [Rhizomicrobium sp.]
MILIALGGNLVSRVGTPAQTLAAALAAIAKQGVTVAAVSPYYVSPAWPDPSEPSFVNAVARIETMLPPPALLELLHATETAFGRVRSVRNAPRTLDLDLIDYDGRVERGPPELPHPRLADRAFVLLPLADLAPHWIHPVTGTPLGTLIAALPAAERRLEKLTSRG